MSSSCIGILALQGAFARHQAAVEALGRQTGLVRAPEDLDGLDGLIIPGGESTVIAKLLSLSGLLEAIKAAAAGGLPIFGTCAGLILLANEVDGLSASGLNLLDVRVERNGYGRQKDSFTTELQWRGKAFDCVFIRAPRILETGPEVEVLCSREGEPVFVRQGAILASAFHPELTDNPEIHRYFLDEVCL